MRKVKIEETFLIDQKIWCQNGYNSINPGLHKRLLLYDDTVVWIEFNNDNGYINNYHVIKELEKMYVALTREQQISSVID